MKVILTEKVPTLGNVGEIVNVSPGYARNFLIPGQKAVVADEGNKAQIDHYNKMLSKKVEEQKNDALATKKKLDGMTLDFIKKAGANGRLFGTVTTVELSKELESKGIVVERRVLSVDAPIKSLGAYVVTAKLFDGVEAQFNVKVEIDPKQAEELKKKQEAMAKKKKEKEEMEAAAGEKTDEETEEKRPLTDEEKLAKEADALLRS